MPDTCPETPGAIILVMVGAKIIPIIQIKVAHKVICANRLDK
jgi:hypothetical protein